MHPYTLAGGVPGSAMLGPALCDPFARVLRPIPLGVGLIVESVFGPAVFSANGCGTSQVGFTI